MMENNDKVKTSIFIDRELWQKFKLFCVRNKIVISDRLEELISKELRK